MNRLMAGITVLQRRARRGAAAGVMLLNRVAGRHAAGIAAGFMAAVTAGAAAAAPTAAVGILCSIVNPPVVTVNPGSLAGVLTVTRAPGAFGQPAQFVLNVTNTGGATVTGLAAVLRSDGAAAVGAPAPLLVPTLSPGGSAAFTWTAVPSDSQAATFSAVATGWTASGTGTVPVALAAVSVLLPGIPAPGASDSYVFPSPARDTARIVYAMAEAGTATIRVYTAGGSLVALLEEAHSAGLQFASITTARLAPGVYLYLIERRYGSGASDRIGPRKFAVAR